MNYLADSEEGLDDGRYGFYRDFENNVGLEDWYSETEGAEDEDKAAKEALIKKGKQKIGY